MLAHQQQLDGHRVLVAGPARVPEFQRFLRRLGLNFIDVRVSGKINLRAKREIHALLRDARADVLHTHLSTASWHGLPVARRLGILAVGHVHALNSPFWYQSADVVITCTHGIARFLKRRGLRPPVRPVWYGLLDEEFACIRPRDEVRAELGIDPDQPLICCVASLLPRKGHRYLLEALPTLLHRFANLAVLLMGDGPLRWALERQARKLGIHKHVRFLGWRADRLDIVAACDLLVLPSVAVEGAAICVLEAARLGVPAVATKLEGGLQESIADGETGLLVPPRNSAALAEATASLLSDPARRAEMGRRAASRAVELFSLPRMAREVEAIYRQFTPSKPAPAQADDAAD